MACPERVGRWSQKGGAGNLRAPTPNPRNLMGFLVAFKAVDGSAHGVGSFYHRLAERRTPYH